MTLNWVLIVWSMAASASLTLAAIHFLVWFKNRAAWVNLLFSLAAIAAVATAGCELWMMRAETPAEFGTAVRWAQVAVWMVILSLTGFVLLYLRAGRRWLAWTICGLRTFSLALNFLVGQNLNYLEITGLRHIRFLGESVAVAEGVANPWMLVGQLSLVLLMTFVADATISVWRRGERRLALVTGGSILLCILSATVQAVLVFWGSAHWPLTPSLFFVVIVVAMSYEMSRDVFRAAQLARTSEHKLRALYEASNVGIVLTDMNTRYIDFNETFRRFTGYRADELRALEYRTLTAEKDRAGTDEQLELAKRNGHFGPYEKEYIRKDGSRIPLRFNGALFTGDDGKNYLWSIVNDITDQRRLERALLHSTSMEQEKLGRDLHDGLGQELAGISLLAVAIASSLKKDGRPEAAELENLANVARQAIANCRAIAHGLSPLTFADGGLLEVLNEMVSLQRNSFGIDARCEVTEGAAIRLGPDALDNLYRISQEAVTNARRHGQAKSIKVTLDVQPTTVRLDILDDGVGFSQPTTQPTSMGLKIMQFRAVNMSARLSIGPGERDPRIY